MDPATPADALNLDPETPPVSPPPEAADDARPATAADELRAVEHRLAIARNRMMRRLVEVSRRVDHAREKMDVGRTIAAHPFAAVGAALGVGALLALPGKRGSGSRTVPARLGGVVGAIAIGLIKDGLGAWVKRSIAHAAAETPPSTPAAGVAPPAAPTTLRGLSPVTA